MALPKKTVDRMAMILFVLIGLLLFILSSMSFSKLPSGCTDKAVHDGLTLSMVIGAVLITVSISYVACNRSSICYGENVKVAGMDFYFLLSGTISLILTVSMGVVLGKLNHSSTCSNFSDDDLSNISKVKVNVGFMFALSLLALLGSGFGIYYTAYVIAPAQLAK